MKLLTKAVAVLRGMRLRGKVASCGAHLRINGKIKISGEGRIVIGERFRTQGFVTLICEAGATLVIGDNVFINDCSVLAATDGILIGDNLLIGPEVRFMDGDYHDICNISAPGKHAPINIGSNVWICARAMILKGVTVGDGAVVGAASLVTRDVALGTMVHGNPARFVKTLYPAVDAPA